MKKKIVATFNDIVERVTVVDGECWLWNGQLDKYGYARTTFKGVTVLVHRLSYTFAKGVIPKGMTVDHLCFQRSCANPAHLRLLTHSENATNKQSLFSPYCGNGHLRTEENTRYRPDDRDPNRTRRRCIDCERDAGARRTARQRASA